MAIKARKKAKAMFTGKMMRKRFEAMVLKFVTAAPRWAGITHGDASSLASSDCAAFQNDDLIAAFD
jgi:hypothetical protein